MGRPRKPVETYMWENLEAHRDALTGEINCTTLAEDAIAAHELEEGDDDATDWVYDLAVNVADRDAHRKQGRLRFGSAVGAYINNRDSSFF